MPAKLTSARIHFGGPLRYRLLSLAELSQSILEASIRRAFKGPRRPGWNLFVEAATTMLKKRMATAFNLRDVNKARSYLDSISINSSALAEINIRQVVQEKVIGSWFNPKNADPSVTILYFHGGGYSFYPSAYTSFIAQIAVASKSRTFALDYRLAPEHRFPTQLEDALNAYRWLLDNGNDPNSLVVAGDSAGANLALSLLLAARDSNLPQPALAIALSPPTDFGLEIVGENEFDWIDLRALFAWRDWFCDSSQRHNPLISPLYADLRGLSPVYIQCGKCEVLYESILEFASHAKNQSADLVFESWGDMNHVFQIFGDEAPQSVEALHRIGQVIDTRVRRLHTNEPAAQILEKSPIAVTEDKTA